MQIRTFLKKILETMYNTHRDFDGYFYRKKSAYYTRVNTVTQTY